MSLIMIHTENPFKSESIILNDADTEVKIDTTDLNEGVIFEGYKGHDTFYIEN